MGNSHGRRRGRGFGPGQFSDSSEDERVRRYEREEYGRNSDDDSDGGAHSTMASWADDPEPPKRREMVNLKYETGESDDDEAIANKEINTHLSSIDYGNVLRVRSIYWRICDFSECDIYNEKGFVRSPVYVTGQYNRFQFYFVIEKFGTDENAQFGVYACVLQNSKFASVSYQANIIEERGHRIRLAKKDSICKRRTGLRFLGYVMDLDSGWRTERYVPENELTLMFKINVRYKESPTFDDLEDLFGNNKVMDVTLIVGDKHFPANRKILSAKSITFSKLLEKNADVRKIEIKDVSPEVMKQLLLFIYTGIVPKLYTYKKELLTAATKYKLNELKGMCKKVKP